MVHERSECAGEWLRDFVAVWVRCDPQKEMASSFSGIIPGSGGGHFHACLVLSHARRGRLSPSWPLLLAVGDFWTLVVHLLRLDDDTDVVLDVPDVVIDSLQLVDVMWGFDQDRDIPVPTVESGQITEKSLKIHR